MELAVLLSIRAQRLIRRIREELYGLAELEAELIRKRAELRVPIS